MSQLLAPTHTRVDAIPLGRRIAEIMHEKGAAYTISAMAKRLDINRETLRLMLKGEREIYTFELEKIAQDLKLSVERILQSDVAGDRQRLSDMLRTHEHAQQAIELSDELMSSAVGWSELCQTSNQKARCRYFIGKYDEAQEIWAQAIPIAQMVLEKYADAALIVRMVSNIMLTYSIRKDFVAIRASYKQIEPFLDQYPEQAVVAVGVLATTTFHEGEFEEAREISYRWLNYAQRTHNSRIYIRSLVNTATVEYTMQNYSKAYQLLSGAVDHFVDAVDPYHISLHYQEYAKTLYRLNNLDESIEMLILAEKYLKLVKYESDFNPASQLFFLKAIIKREFSDLEQHVERIDLSESLRKIFCQLLSDHYARQGNFELKEKYEGIKYRQYHAIDKLLIGSDLDSDTLLNIFGFCCSIGWHHNVQTKVHSH